MDKVVCTKCGRERTDKDHEYNYVNVMLRGLVGWFSGEDGGFCPEDMTKMMNTSNQVKFYRPDIETG